MIYGSYNNGFDIPKYLSGGSQYLPKRSMVIKNKIKKNRGRKKAQNIDSPILTGRKPRPNAATDGRKPV